MNDPTSNPTGDPKGLAEKDNSIPTSISALRRRTQPRPPLGPLMVRGLIGEIHPRQLGLGLILIALVALLLARTSFKPIPDYKAGDIAKSDLATTEDLTIQNHELTKLEKERVISDVPVVYDYDPNVLKNLLSQFHAYWEESRRILARPGKKTDQETALSSIFRHIFNRPPSRQLLQSLIGRHFNAAIESQIAGLLQPILRDGVVNNADPIEAAPLTAKVVLHNIDNNSEILLSPPVPVKSLSRARELLRDQMIRSEVLPPDLSEELSSDVEGLITINGLYNQHETMRRRSVAAQHVRAVLIQIPSRTTILHEGQPVSAGAVDTLNAMRELQARSRRPGYFIGLYLAILLFFFFIWRFLLQRPAGEISPHRQFLLIISTFVVMLVLTKVLLFTFEVIIRNASSLPFSDPLSSKFAIPFAAGAMLITLLLDANVGMIFAIIFSLFVGYLARSPFLSIYALVSSMAAIYAVRQYRDRNAVIKASLIVGVSNFLIVLGLSLVGERPSAWGTLPFDLANTLVGGFFVAGFVSLLLPLFESAFDICTDVRLLELSNLNLPILRRLAAEAPGTYHHSILVGILAESAAEAVGANALLARVACLYHDIGKMVKPSYYIENSKEATQRHEQLAPSMSSLVIIDHVKEGVELAHQIRLPRRVTDIIPQHHGTSLVTYFYHKAKSDVDADDVGITEEQFRYPGPRPKSKEAALIMLADSVEAASRTVENPNPKRLENVVGRIVQRFVNDHQLDDSQLTLCEITIAKLAFTKALAGIYHQRIAYPGYDFSQDSAEVSTS